MGVHCTLAIPSHCGRTLPVGRPKAGLAPSPAANAKFDDERGWNRRGPLENCQRRPSLSFCVCYVPHRRSFTDQATVPATTSSCFFIITSCLVFLGSIFLFVGICGSRYLFSRVRCLPFYSLVQLIWLLDIQHQTPSINVNFGLDLHFPAGHISSSFLLTPLIRVFFRRRLFLPFLFSGFCLALGVQLPAPLPVQ